MDNNMVFWTMTRKLKEKTDKEEHAENMKCKLPHTIKIRQDAEQQEFEDPSESRHCLRAGSRLSGGAQGNLGNNF